MSRYDIIILDCPEIKCPPPLLKVFIELCEAFTRKGYKVTVSNSLNNIHDNSIVFMGDGFRINAPADRLYQQSKQAIYIGWYWHNQNVSILPYFIHIYENMMSNRLSPDKRNMLAFMKSIPNSCPLLLRANEPIETVGLLVRNVDKHFCYMGVKICETLIPRKPYTGLYYGTNKCSKYLNYEERKRQYLSSVFALGFQTTENVINAHVSQRIYEGLCYGCIVLSNSIHACAQTGWLVEYVRDINDVETKMEYFIQHPHKIKEKQDCAYSFIREMGTNNYSVQLIVDVINRAYNIEIFF